MSPIKSILSVALACSCLFGTISSAALNETISASLVSSSKTESTSSQESSTISLSSSLTNSNSTKDSDIQKLGKKYLKKSLSLDYTDPKFENEINQSQKDAILKALKKWKGELPMDNKFTVTSYANLKSDTLTSKNQSKKKAKKTPNALVVYMWASIPNPKWDNSKIFNYKDYEEGDPRTINIEFNVLLKQNKNDWKAILERDVDVKTESLDLIEIPEDVKIMQDLFSTNKTDNLFTSDAEVLFESSSSITTTPISQNVLSSISSISSSSNQNSVSTSSKTIGLLDILFNSPKVSAGDTDYSWPWKSGQTWTVNTGYGWHECSKPSETEYSYSEGIVVSGCAFDMSPNSSANSEILAPKSGNIRRACKDSSQGFVRIGEMSILHINQNGMIADNVSVTKSQKIGDMFYPTSYNLPGNGFTSRCGTLYGAHIHIKFATTPMIIDGTTITHNSSLPSTLTSQNQSKPPITLPNMTSVQPPQNAWWKALDSNCRLDSIVVIKARDNGDCQKLQFYSDYSIRNPFGQCLDAGSPTKKLIFFNCNNTDNQKWKQENSSGKIWSFARENGTNNVRCIEYSGLNDNDEVSILPCSSDSRQKWWFDVGITQENLPATIAAFNNYTSQLWPQDNGNFRFGVDGTNYDNNPAVKLQSYTNGLSQKWGFDWNTRQIKGINDKCLDAGNVNDSNNRWLRVSNCHGGLNQKWYLDTVGRIHSEEKNSLCIDSASGSNNNSTLYIGACHSLNNQKWSGNISMNSKETFYPLYSAYNNSFGFDIWGGTANGTAIKLGQIWGGNNQQFEYNSTSQEIRSKDGRCVDAGDINNSNNRWLRINTCHNGQNQKFYADNYGRIRSNASSNLCIDSANGDANGSTIYMGGCHLGNNQRWWWKGYLN